MNAKSVFARYLIFLFGMLLAGNVYLPGHYNIPYPQTLGPQFKANVKRDRIDAISANRPAVVLIGDSVLYLGIDQQALSQQLGVETYSIGMPGFGSAAWYLILKNVVLGGSHRPEVVVVMFRDTMLTIPEFRTTGRYFAAIDDFAGRREPLLTELAFVNRMNPLEKLAGQYFPLYSARWELREALDSRVRYMPSSLLLDCSAECTDEAINSIFARGLVDAVAFNQAVEDAGETLYALEAMDFDGKIDRSFLPAMIQLAQENNIKLVFVRTRTLVFPEYSSEPPALRNYMESLDAYISGQWAYFIDFAHDERIKDEYFSDILHFNPSGMQAFTGMLAEELKVLLKQ
jgi:hypothetical protein